MDSNGCSHLNEAVVCAAGFYVFPAIRARASRIATEPQPLALAAPPPIRLARTAIVSQSVVTTSDFYVVATSRTFTGWVATEPKSLTLVAPPSVRLTGNAGRVHYQTVVCATNFGVRSTCRAFASGVAAEPKPLTLAAPSPVPLSIPSHRQPPLLVVSSEQLIEHLLRLYQSLERWVPQASSSPGVICADTKKPNLIISVRRKVGRIIKLELRNTVHDPRVWVHHLSTRPSFNMP